MIEINLLKYLDKSFSEIYEIEHSVQEQPQKKKKISFLKLYIVTGSVLLLLAIIVTFYLIIHEKPSQEANNISIQKLPMSDNYSNTINKKEEYKIIGTINVSDNEKSNNLASKNNDNSKTDTKKIEKLNDTKNKDIVATEKTEPILPKKTDNSNNQKIKNISSSIYVILIDNISDNELRILKSSIKDKKISIINSLKKNEKIWELYIPASGTKTFIGQHEVKKIEEFRTKDDAIKYAKKLNEKVFIKSKENIIRYHTVQISDFQNINEAKKYTEKITLKGKVLKILKKSN